MNLRRGLFRIWVVASLIWLIGWHWYVWATCETKHIPFSSQGEPWKEYVKFCYTGFGEWMTQVQNFTFWDYASIAATGVGVPIAAFVIGFGLLWAADGFRSHPNRAKGSESD
jgi:hypothetical protein